MATKPKREIGEVLHFRTDISPFLVHLTRDRAGANKKTMTSAKETLRRILIEGKLSPSDSPTSDVRWAGKWRSMTETEKKRFFGAICLTETPLAEIHCLLDIKNRAVDLKPYGLVFRLDKLVSKGVNPVFYVNNTEGQRLELLRGLFALSSSDEKIAESLLPLITFFGQQVSEPGAMPTRAQMDFRWEREWRRPAALGDMAFGAEDVFVGLCPDGERAEFKKLMPSIDFIDPMRPARWYASQLVDARKRLGLEYSVV